MKAFTSKDFGRIGPFSELFAPGAFKLQILLLFWPSISPWEPLIVCQMIAHIVVNFSPFNNFDKIIIDFVLNHFDRSYKTYHTIYFIAGGDNLIKGGVFSLLIWYLWFRPQSEVLENRISLLTTIFSIFFVMVITLGLGGIIPFRTRPIMNHDFLFTSSYDLDPYIGKMNSFPSDHAALFISLATGFLFISKRIGIATIIFTIVFILFPRVYLGYHYPTDLLAGSMIGAAVTTYFNRSKMIRRWIAEKVIPLEQKHAVFFYPLLFFTTYEIADLFAGSRDVIFFFVGLHKHSLYMFIPFL